MEARFPKVQRLAMGQGRLEAAKAYLPRVRFLTLHYTYFIAVCLITSVIFWASSTPFGSVRYTDSLFFTVSAMTLAGLNTVNLSTLNTFQQTLLFVLIMLGSAILVSSFVIYIRQRAFEDKFEGLELEERLWRRPSTSGGIGRRFSANRSFSRQSINTQPARQSGGLRSPRLLPTSRSRSGISARGNWTKPERIQRDAHSGGVDGPETELQSNATAHLEDHDIHPTVTAGPSAIEKPLSEPPGHENHIIFSNDVMQGLGERPPGLQRRILSSQSVDPGSRPRPPGRTGGNRDWSNLDVTSEDVSNHPFKIGRNSTFHDLSESDREKLGGVEYRALRLLSVIVPTYFVLWQLLGCLGAGAYIARNRASVTEENGINPWWAGAFFAVSAFNNSGMSLVDANMVPFQSSTYLLITMGLLILAGNTCYPIFLRLILWAIRLLLPDNENYRRYRETLRFLLDHPRRCYTNLFPAAHTRWLVLSVIVLNGIDWIAFVVLNIKNPAVKSIPPGPRVLDGLFQALCVRSGGFYVIGIPTLRIGLQVLYVVMMYISVYPVVITMRNSNVYEERSLGIYADDATLSDGQASSSDEPQKRLPAFFPSGRRYFIRQQLRAQLAHDLWWIVCAVIIISIVETDNFDRDPVTYSTFNIIFETVSAYGCVGISTGLPDQMYSFSGGWHTLSKLVLCAVMIRGRHRGLPVAIDKAILLPGEHLAAAEEEDAQIRLEHTLSRGRGEFVCSPA